jgi:hypothetical protein
MRQDQNKIQKAAVERINREWPSNEHVRGIEVFLLRYGAMSGSPMSELENLCPGGGILVAYDLQGRKYKIEITQVEGPI